jgi:flavin-dependent dehydrogenase
VILLARRVGGDVREGRAVVDLIEEGDWATGIVYTDEGGRQRSAAARFVVAACCVTRARVRRSDPRFRRSW